MSKSQFEKPSRLSEGLGSFQTTQVRTNTGPETKEAIFARMNQERDMSKIRTIPAMPDINPFDAAPGKGPLYIAVSARTASHRHRRLRRSSGTI